MNDKQLSNFYDVLACLAMVAITTLIVLALTHGNEVRPANVEQPTYKIASTTIDCTVTIKADRTKDWTLMVIKQDGVECDKFRHLLGQ